MPIVHLHDCCMSSAGFLRVQTNDRCCVMCRNDAVLLVVWISSLMPALRRHIQAAKIPLCSSCWHDLHVECGWFILHQLLKPGP